MEKSIGLPTTLFFVLFIFRELSYLGNHVGTALPSSSLPASSPLIQAGEGIKWASLNLIHCWFTSVSSYHFALACSVLLLEVEKILYFFYWPQIQREICVALHRLKSVILCEGISYKFISTAYIRLCFEMPLLSGKELPQTGTSWKILLHNCYLLGNARAVSLKEIPCVCKVPEQRRQRRAETSPWYLQCGHQSADKQAGTGEPLSLHSSLPWLPWKLPRAGQSRQNGNWAVTLL